jgi:hypothetical protein
MDEKPIEEVIGWERNEHPDCDDPETFPWCYETCHPWRRPNPERLEGYEDAERAEVDDLAVWLDGELKPMLWGMWRWDDGTWAVSWDNGPKNGDAFGPTIREALIAAVRKVAGQ